MLGAEAGTNPQWPIAEVVTAVIALIGALTLWIKKVATTPPRPSLDISDDHPKEGIEQPKISAHIETEVVVQNHDRLILRIRVVAPIPAAQADELVWSKQVTEAVLSEFEAIGIGTVMAHHAEWDDLLRQSILVVEMLVEPKKK